MSRRAWALALAWALAGAIEVRAGSATTPPPAPFYRKYLVPGNRLDDQILEQEKRVEASPADASLRNDLGNLLALRHFPKEAEQEYEKAAELDKTNFIAYYNLGLVYESEGKASSAQSAYQKSISRKHGFPPAHFRLGHLYERGGNTSAAVEEYALAMRIDPGMRDPRRNPLVVASDLMYQASLLNYQRDMARASFRTEAVYVEENRFRAVPVDRAVSSQEVAGQDEAESESEPRQVGAADAAAGSGGATQGSGSAGGARKVAPRATSADNPANPMLGHPRNVNTARPKPVRPGAPPAGASAAAPPASPGAPAPAAVAPPAEPEQPPESMPEPTPSVPDEVEPS